jgi:cell division transport system permease protein
MIITSFYRITKTAFISLWRNQWLSLAATLVMVLTLITISFFISLLIVTNKTTETLREKADMTVYFNDEATNDQIFATQNILISRSDVKNVEYISKEKALESWRNRAGNEEIRDVITESDNPLPRSLEIKTVVPEDLDKVNTYLTGEEYKPLIKKISYEVNKNLIDRLVKITRLVKIVGYSLSALFVLIAVLIILNTIRLTIFARSEEIEIMKLVGGTDWYVRGPFIIEGISYGILGAIGSSILLYFFSRLSIPAVGRFLELPDFNNSYLGVSMTLMIVLQFVIGIFLGGLCSVLAIKKHLK